jgi:thiamine phosphate synthase YjbQ (UPF0047 family)
VKSHTEHLWFETEEREEFVCITPHLEQIQRRTGIAEGFMLVSTMHTKNHFWCCER